MRRLVAILTLTTALLGLGALPAVAGGPNNIVVSDATVDAAGAATFDTHSSMVAGSTGTDEVTSANVARAVAHDCTGCQAIAVAFQAVLTTGNPHVVTPRNIAFAENQSCNGCASFAFAFQYVVSTGGSAHLSAEGHQQVAALREEVQQDLATDLTPQDLAARLEDIGTRFKAVVDNDIVRTGGSPHDGELREQDDATPAAA
jgi:putative peptide zinc metalloprotease protein